MHLELVFDDLGDFAQAYRGRISVEGMLLFCAAPLPSGTVIELSIALRDGLVLISGRGGVLRTSIGTFTGRELHTAALRFVQLDEDSEALIQRMEERHESEGVRPFNLDETLIHWGRVGGIEHDAAGRPLPSTRLLESSTVEDADVSVQPVSDIRQPAPQRPLELYDMVTTALDDESAPARADTKTVEDDNGRGHKPARRRVPGALLVILAAVTVAAVVVAAALRFFPNLILPEIGSTDAPPATVALEPTATSPPASVPTAAPADDELTTTGITPQTAVPSAAAEPNLEPTQNPPATNTPVPATATPTPAHSTDAQAVRELSWQENDGRTTVSILCDHPIGMDRITHFRLTDPPGPRYVVQISNVDSSHLPYTTRVNSQQVATIRAWHHTEQSPPSLHIVMDLTASSVQLDTLEEDGARIVLSFSQH